MEESGSKGSSRLFNLEELTALRREIHKHPEIAFQEFETCKRIKNHLNKLGFKEGKVDEHMTYVSCTETGIQCEIKGQGQSVGSPLRIMIRADIDALPTVETNESLEYQSVNKGKGHLCGHDGHIAMMLGGIALIVENLDKLPSNRSVRVLFQPAEEGMAGAKYCIEEGVLDNVVESYGIHNVPHIPIGEIGVCPGAIMAQMVIIKIKIIGKGGHGSDMVGTINPVRIGFDFYEQFLKMVEELSKKDSTFRCTLPSLNGGAATNVVPDLVEFAGTIRVFSVGIREEVKEAIRKLLGEMEIKYNCKTEVEFEGLGKQPTINSKGAAEFVRQVGNELLGEGKASNQGTPIYASEDFGLFLEQKPGCFFFLGTYEGGEKGTLHTSNYNFNDNALETGAKMWLELVRRRLNHEPVSLD